MLIKDKDLDELLDTTEKIGAVKELGRISDKLSEYINSNLPSNVVVCAIANYLVFEYDRLGVM